MRDHRSARAHPKLRSACPETLAEDEACSLRVVYVPDEDGFALFVIEAFDLTGKALAADRRRRGGSLRRGREPSGAANNPSASTVLTCFDRGRVAP
jgi:hypothetical protein